jgi:hypothetical protein
MVGYNYLVSIFESKGYAASTIYSIFYTSYIPVGHLLQCLFVIGWPTNYVQNLLSNAPIGLTAMVIGTMLTGFLSNMHFNSAVEDWISSTFGTEPRNPMDDEGEFYSSLVVMVATGIWCYVLSLYVNATPAPVAHAKDDKDPGKEL